MYLQKLLPITPLRTFFTNSFRELTEPRSTLRTLQEPLGPRLRTSVVKHPFCGLSFYMGLVQESSEALIFIGYFGANTWLCQPRFFYRGRTGMCPWILGECLLLSEIRSMETDWSWTGQDRKHKLALVCLFTSCSLNSRVHTC